MTYLRAAWIYAAAYLQYARDRIDEYEWTARIDRARALRGLPPLN